MIKCLIVHVSNRYSINELLVIEINTNVHREPTDKLLGYYFLLLLDLYVTI